MKFSVLSTTLAVLATLVAPAAAAPLKLEQRDVWVPAITYPTAGVTWHSGEVHNVTWNTAGAPKTISNAFSVRLRGSNITTPVVLAQNFDPRTGAVNITVPLVMSASNYSIVLFGDSGNISPEFSILQ